MKKNKLPPSKPKIPLRCLYCDKTDEEHWEGQYCYPPPFFLKPFFKLMDKLFA